MQIKKGVISIFILIASMAAIIACGIDGRSDVQGTGPKYKEVRVAYGTFEVIVTANGVVKPIDRIEIKSKASGEIEELPIEEGDVVHKGDLIARLDQKDERTEVEQAQADMDIAKAELKEAKRTFDRRDRLYRNKLLSEEEKGQIELSLAVAKSKLVQAKSTLDRAKERLNESVVRAPIDGIILQKYVEEGQIIASGVSSVSGGTPIVDIADMRSVHIETGVDEIDIGKIEIGQPATVVAEAYPEITFQGKIIRVAPEAKIEQNVTLFDVIVEVGNRESKLKSGMNTTIEVTIVNEPNVLLAPAMALQMPEERNAAPNERTVLLKEGDRFVFHPVKIGRSNFKQAVILSGLSEGDILGVPMTSRLKAENDRLENRIKSSRSFGTKKTKSNPH